MGSGPALPPRREGTASRIVVPLRRPRRHRQGKAPGPAAPRDREPLLALRALAQLPAQFSRPPPHREARHHDDGVLLPRGRIDAAGAALLRRHAVAGGSPGTGGRCRGRSSFAAASAATSRRRAPEPTGSGSPTRTSSSRRSVSTPWRISCRDETMRFCFPGPPAAPLCCRKTTRSCKEVARVRPCSRYRRRRFRSVGDPTTGRKALTRSRTATSPVPAGTAHRSAPTRDPRNAGASAMKTPRFAG